MKRVQLALFFAALGAYVMLAMVSPQHAHAASIDSTFLTSSTGTNEIAIGDTIQFEVNLTLDLGVEYNTVLWRIAGDAYGMAANPIHDTSWPMVAHNVTNWSWHYSPAGGGRVDFGANQPIAPADYSSVLVNRPPPVPTIVGLGWFGAIRTGTGQPSLVGTVTITADESGTFQGGGLFVARVDGFCSAGSCPDPVVNPGEFVVLPSDPGPPTTAVPEPTAALLFAAGGLVFALRIRGT